MEEVIQAYVEEYPSNWASQLPIARWAWNTTRKRSLGGMSPYQVITGMVPRSPLASWLKLPSKDRVTPQEYVDELLHATEQIYETVRKAQQERADENQAKALKGHIPAPLEVGSIGAVTEATSSCTPRWRGAQGLSKAPVEGSA